MESSAGAPGAGGAGGWEAGAYAAADDAVVPVALGVPGQVLPKVFGDGYTSKLGGSPVGSWEAAACASFIRSLTCAARSTMQAWLKDDRGNSETTAVPIIPSCKVCSSPLFLVVQVYAPVEHPRTLYIFACNSSKCANRPGTWRVLRRQHRPAAAAPLENVSGCGGDVGVGVPEDDTAAGDAAGWDAPAAAVDAGAWGDASTAEAGSWAAPTGEAADDDAGGWGDASTAEAGGWGASAGGSVALPTQDEGGRGGTSADAVVDTTAVAAGGTAATPSVPPAPHATDSTRIGVVDAEVVAKHAFPSFALDTIDEPAGTDVDELAHEKALYRKYLAATAKEGDAGAVDDLEATDDLADDASGKGGRPKGKSKGKGKGGKGGGNAEKYERTPEKYKYLMRFQKRVRREPAQVVRYAYGGEPLWPAAPPKRLKVPRCSCGEERAFELQLLPSLLHVLSVDDHVVLQTAVRAHGAAVPPLPKHSRHVGRGRGATRGRGRGAAAGGAGPPKAAQLPPALIGGGMDWSTVVVYSCRSSCDASSEEHVYVQRAADK